MPTQTRTCRLTGKEFFVTDEDQAFYEKFDIPAPTLCPDELWRNLYAYRNEWALFSRTCSKTGAPMLSCYRPDTAFPVYNHKLWWSDEWTAFDYGRDLPAGRQGFDFNKPFFEQYKNLQDVVPRVGTTIFNSENCDFNSHARYSKDSYMCSLFTKTEKAYYSYWTVEGYNVFDSAISTGCRDMVSCLDMSRCSRCVSCQECRDCQECYFSYELRNCQNCIACTDLVGKQYYIYNKPSTKEEYEKIIKLLKSDGNMWNKAFEVFSKIHADSPRPSAELQNIENVSGDHLSHCRDCFECFDGWDSENCCHVQSFGGARDSVWCYSLGFPVSEKCHHTCVMTNVFDVAYSFYCFDSKNLAYCDSCRNSSDLFGCIGVNHGKYAIMNKAYSEAEYETLRTKIIDHMKSTGEWGEFFPLSVAPHPYDDTCAMDWLPLTREEVEKRGGRWGGEVETHLTPTANSPLHISQYDERVVGAETAQKNIETLLKSVFKCTLTGKPFQIIRQELVFHVENSIPLPTVHPRERIRELMKLRNPRKLFERKCDECGINMKTSYAPERPEKVLCESCWQKVMY